jgi:hypothetical protein
MDVRDQAIKIDKARDQYREAQEELKGSYDKNLKQVKDTFEGKLEKQSKNYDIHKTKLEEDNQISNQVYSEKTRNAINSSQEDFKNKLRENGAKFEKERSSSKSELNEKLSNLSESFTKSFDENNRFQDQIKKSMGERYNSANKRYQSEFNDQISNMDAKFKSESSASRAAEQKDRLGLIQKNSEELENLRSNSNEQKFKEVSRLKNDSENLRTTMGRENQLLKDRQDERVAELFKLKGKESEDGMKVFQNLQKNIREKNLQSQEKQNTSHTKESKELETKFNEDVRNIQKIATQKIRGGTSADTIGDELKQTKMSYENRLQTARDELSRNSMHSIEKEESIDNTYREKLKEMKTAGVENVAKKDAEANDTLKKTVKDFRDKNTLMEDNFKTENGTLKRESEDRLSNVALDSKNKIKEQRVEFGRVVNTLNDKSMETINALKEDFTKDKSTSIEKSKKEFNEDKVAMKNEFVRQNSLKETLYEQKLAEMEKQTNKVIENYENRISQIVKKADTEVTSIKTKEEIRKLKDDQANKLAFDTIEQQNNNDLNQLRDKYVGVIAKNQAMTEQKTNAIVNKYESQLARERSDQQKELTVRLSEAQSQFERLYKNSEIEKETIRNQYEQRIENMKLASMTQDNLKKT